MKLVDYSIQLKKKIRESEVILKGKGHKGIFFIKECKLINAEVMTEFKNQYSSMTTVKTDLGKDCQYANRC